MADRYTRASQSLEAIVRKQNKARSEGQAVALFGSAERNRDRIRAEQAAERQGRRQGIANALGTAAGIAAGIFAGPAVGAVVGGAVTGLARQGANAGWREPSRSLTFADNREALRGMMRPNAGQEVGIMANAATTGFQAGKLFDQIGINRAMSSLTETERAFARPEDFNRRGLSTSWDADPARQRYISSTADMFGETEAMRRADLQVGDGTLQGVSFISRGNRLRLTDLLNPRR